MERYKPIYTIQSCFNGVIEYNVGSEWKQYHIISEKIFCDFITIIKKSVEEEKSIKLRGSDRNLETITTYLTEENYSIESLDSVTTITTGENYVENK